MSVLEWSKSNVDYGRKLVNSAIEGARNGSGEFHESRSPGAHACDALMHALSPAVFAACMGAWCGSVGSRRALSRKLACSALGGIIGFSAGMLWESRRLTSGIAFSVRKSLRQTRDEHWIENHPIDYA